MGKKAHHEEHENLEAWVIPYADLLTLLLAMFLALYATSNTDLQKLKALATAFRSEAGGKPSEAVDAGVKNGGNGDNQVLQNGAGALNGNGISVLQKQVLADIQKAVASAGEKALNEQAAQKAAVAKAAEQSGAAQNTIEKALSAAGQNQNVKITSGPDGLTLSISEDLAQGLSFQSGSATLTTPGFLVLGSIAEALKSVEGQIQVIGHTDSLGDATTNQQLSLARANAVATAISETYAIPRNRILTGGMGESQLLIVPDTTNEAHNKNRRVEVKILSPKPLTGATSEPTGAPAVNPTASAIDSTTTSETVAGGTHG